MTLEEIKTLKIKDKYGESKVAAIEEMLDISKGKIKLFIELKGETADKKMANDLVTMVKERNMLDDCVFISLKYDVINYIETQYPEITTGYLCGFSLNYLTKLNYDYLLIEEKIASRGTIMLAHLLGKKVIVWTVDEESSINYFLNSNVDGIITNEIEKAQDIKLQNIMTLKSHYTIAVEE